MGRVAEEHIPLNVKTYGEGFFRLQGWICFSCLAFLTAGLLVLYELMLINVEDQDFRDILFDYRITRDGISYQHRYFANGLRCCHQDSAVFKYTCGTGSSYIDAFGSGPPYCPVTVQFSCPNLASDSCNNLRALLYPAVGLDLSGHPSDCSRAGQVLLRARSGPGYKLTVQLNGRVLEQQLSLPNDPSTVASSVVDDFVADVIASHADPMFKVPSEPLSRAVRVEGHQVLLFSQVQPGTPDKWGQFGWPWELWPWPPSAACTKTGQLPVLSLEGGYQVTFQAFVPDPGSPQPSFTVGMYGDSLTVPQYRQVVVEEAGSEGGSPTVRVQALTSVNLTVGLVAPLDGCEAWQLHKPLITSQYEGDVWQGPADELAALSQPLTVGAQVLGLSVRDVSQPQPLALPWYHGELYVYVALALGGIWMFATAPLIIMFGLVLINVQRNRGLPIFLYKYMRKYRGW